MDIETKKCLNDICAELSGIRKSLEFLAMLEAYREGISVSAAVPEKRRKKKKSIKDPGTGAKIKTNTGNAAKTNAGPGSAVKGIVKHKTGAEDRGGVRTQLMFDDPDPDVWEI